MTNPNDDERASAYIDNELDPLERDAVEAEMARNEALTKAADSFRRVDDLIRATLDEALSAQTSTRFERLIRARIVAAEPAKKASPGFVARLNRTPLAPAAIAASLALAFGFASGVWLSSGDYDAHDLLLSDAAVIAPEHPLFKALETTPSATRIALGPQDAFLPVLSFQAADGTFCREFELTSNRVGSVGVACRESDYWRVEVLLAAEAAPNTSAGYAQAAGYNAAALDAVMADLGAGEALSAQGEAQAIANTWRREK